MPRSKKEHRKSPGRQDRLVEAMPSAAVIPLRPVFDEHSDSAKIIKDPRPIRFESSPTNFAEMERNRLQISDEFRKRYLEGDRDALYELLDYNLAFAYDPWVHDAIVQQYAEGFPKRRRGRPRGSEQDTAGRSLMIAAVVDHLCRIRGWSKDKTFGELEKELCDGCGEFANLTYDSIKRLYYHARSDSRLKPLLFERPDRRIVCRESELGLEKCIDVAKEIEALRHRHGRSFSADDVTVSLEFTGEFKSSTR